MNLRRPLSRFLSGRIIVVVCRPAFSWSRIIESTARVNILHNVTDQAQRFRKSGIIILFHWLIFRKEVCHEKEMAILIAYACVLAGSFSMLSGSGTGTGTGTGTRARTRARTASHSSAAATATIAVTTVIMITVMPRITSDGSGLGFPFLVLTGSDRTRLMWRRRRFY